MRISTHIFEPRYLGEFTMLPDVNGDGYDDWAFYYSGTDGRTDFDGYYLFYGSEEPDFEPDVVLESNSGIFNSIGNIVGGNFNGDRFGDIVTVNPDAHGNDGITRFYWGRRNISGDADITMNTRERLGVNLYGSLGAVGDYNGDGMDDFVCSYISSFVGGNDYRRLCILTKGDDWVNVVNPTPTLPATPFLINTFPNPFNNSTTVSIKNPGRGDYSIHLLDLNGRTLIEDSFKSSGEETIHGEIDASRLAAGIYLVRCVNKSTGVSACQKAVLLR